ncbi:hypothetical protein CHUAL_008317 [Chamberlinius hualienensis]
MEAKTHMITKFIVFCLLTIITSATTLGISQFSSACCDFESSDCSPTSSNWLWSKQYDPTSYVPKISGEYLWSDQNGAQVTFFKAYGVTPSTNIYFTYYVSSVTAEIQVYFITDDKPPKLLKTLNFTNSGWEQYFAICNDCCQGSLSCDGQISVITVGSDSFATAIDNVEIADHCYDSSYCCYFNDISMCGYIPDNDNNQTWIVSQAKSPVNPPSVSTGSEYIYFETIDYDNPAYLFVNLRSSAHVTITDTTNIRGYFYNVNSNPNNALIISFYDEDKSLAFEVGSIPDTAGMWRIYEFSCSVETCCFGVPCTGFVTINAHVEGNGGTVLYAIDAFDIGNTCDFFPG